MKTIRSCQKRGLINLPVGASMIGSRDDGSWGPLEFLHSGEDECVAIFSRVDPLSLPVSFEDIPRCTWIPARRAGLVLVSCMAIRAQLTRAQLT
jgi:hypothetical protein